MLPKNLMKNVFRFHIKFVVINIQIELEVTLLTIYFALQFERSEVNIRHSCLSNIRGGGVVWYSRWTSRRLFPRNCTRKRRNEVLFKYPCLTLGKNVLDLVNVFSFIYWIKTLFWLVNLKLEYIWTSYVKLYDEEMCNVTFTFEIYSKMKLTLFNWLLK